MAADVWRRSSIARGALVVAVVSALAVSSWAAFNTSPASSHHDASYGPSHGGDGGGGKGDGGYDYGYDYGYGYGYGYDVAAESTTTSTTAGGVDLGGVIPPITVPPLPATIPTVTTIPLTVPTLPSVTVP